MPYKSWNIVKPGDEYRTKDGDNKRKWLPVGTLLFNEDKNKFSMMLNLTGEWYPCFENNYESKAPDSAEGPKPVSEETEKPKW